MTTKELIKKLDNLLSEKKDNKEKCLSLIDGINKRIQLLNFIKTFVGKDGFVPFEHGYRPHRYIGKQTTICYNFTQVYAIGYDFLAMPKKKISITDLTNEQLRITCKILYDYAFYCRYDA